MSDSDRFVDEDAPTLKFAVPVRPGQLGDKSDVGAAAETPAANPALAPVRPDVISADEAAAILGVSRWALYAAANRQEVPHRRLGRRMLFSRRALLLWLEGASPRGVGKE